MGIVAIERLGLIIGPNTHPSLGNNIQGPSVIRTPSWVSDPLGVYLCYFADHKGDHIRLAFADEIAGPWTVVPGGCLTLEDSRFLTEAPTATDQEVADISELYTTQFGTYESVDIHADLTVPHIASPDVHVNETEHTVDMWFHGLAALGHQVTRYATSPNGIDFTVAEETFDGTYLRMFKIDRAEYGVVMPGTVVRRVGGPTDLEIGPILLPPTSRHMATRVDGAELQVFYSEVGDAPERIKMVPVDIRGEWTDWQAGEPVEVLKPEEIWEGADVPLAPSIRSFWPERANQLRDPAIFNDIDGESYLFYAVAGESGIAVARFA